MKHTSPFYYRVAIFLSVALILGSCSKEDVVGPVALPQIALFTATPTTVTAGQAVTLKWTVLNSPTAVSINNGVGAVKNDSSIVVHPTLTTSYVLTASNSAGIVTDTVTVTVAMINGPTDVAANSRSESSVGIAWHRDPADVSADTVIASLNGTVVQRVVAPSPDTTAVVGGLSLNTLYSFSVRSAYGTSASTITWAPAIITQSVRLYETADQKPGENSGVVFTGSALGLGTGAVSVSTSASSADAASADLVFASDMSNPASGLTLISPAVTSISGIDAGRYSKFSEALSVVGGMDNVYYTGDLRSTIGVTGSTIVNAIELTDAANLPPLVFNVLTADDHFARVEVLPQANNGGRLFGGVAGQNFIDLKISYQPLSRTPYAGRAPVLQRNMTPIRWRVH